ncbi:hypothetical protein HGRIS_012074 [Hohenbuehelia grisea]|uniref:Alpha-type protein kinase domain-containing protein n=1 Tax=Hohenbuehelia grisea TaxID=104357 RepID=A0ABR3IR54_9AGAR
MPSLDTSIPIRAMGNIHVPGHSVMPPPPLPCGPTLGAPWVASFGALPLPESLVRPVLEPGYQPAHAHYDSIRSYMAPTWQAKPLPMMKKPTLVSNILEAVSNIPVHIGATELKAVLFYAVLPKFVKRSKGFTLRIEDVELRNSQWAEIVPNTALSSDVDAIAAHFYKSRGNNKGKLTVPTFAPGKGIELYLAIDYEQYEDILTYREKEEDGDSSVTLSAPRLNARDSSRKRKFDVVEDNAGELPVAGVTVPMASQASQGLAPPDSPTADRVLKALQAQGAMPKQNLHSLFDKKTVSFSVFIAPRLLYEALVANPHVYKDLLKQTPIQARITYSTSAIPKSGVFKSALEAVTSSSLFPDSTTELAICMKQCFFTDPATRKQVFYDCRKQAGLLILEMRCLGWASALMDVVYAFIAQMESEVGKPSFEVPSMWFISSGLAIAETEEKQTYLVEERIKDEDGKFIKYICNSSATPTQFKKHPQRRLRAEFLSFAQHVQYMKTRKMAYVSDFQGGLSLLTDPQIITSPELGYVFADGNTNFDKFGSQHECNRFCTFYNLTRDIFDDAEAGAHGKEHPCEAALFLEDTFETWSDSAASEGGGNTQGEKSMDIASTHT